MLGRRQALRAAVGQALSGLAGDTLNPLPLLMAIVVVAVHYRIVLAEEAYLHEVFRNPMYLGVFTTLLAATLYTLNPLLLLIAIFIVAVHHRIVPAEETYLDEVFGGEYAEYRGEVGRYL